MAADCSGFYYGGCWSVVAIYYIWSEKVSVVGAFCGGDFGVEPIFLECLSYKFDAPFIATAVLMMIVPFLA